MRSSLFSGTLVAAMTAGAAAQNTTTSPPFFLKLASKNQTLDGQYLSACHAGAAIEGLCVDSKPPPSSVNSSSFSFNQTDYGSGLSSTGILAWNLPYTGPNGSALLSEPLTFTVGNLGSNLVVPLFQPGDSPVYPLAFDAASKLYMPTFNDSTIVYGQYPNTSLTVDLYNWYACYALTGGYYYNALAWVTAGAPTNPTCQAVSVLREWV